MKRSILIACFCLAIIGLNAQHDDDHKESGDTHHDHSTEHETSHHLHKHHLAIFGGAATNFNHHLTKPGVGLDYEYRISNPLGIGLVAEIEFTEKESFLYSIPVFYHPVNGLKLYAGPALFSTVEHHESESGHDDGHGDTHAEEPKRETQFGGRIGIAYDFFIGKVSIGPTVNYAFGPSNALIYGINLGYGF